MRICETLFSYAKRLRGLAATNFLRALRLFNPAPVIELY